MAHVAAFLILTVTSTIYALWRGGGPERVTAAIVVIGTIVAFLVEPLHLHPYGSVEIGVLLLDIGMMIAFQAVALAADRFWPIWIAGLQQAAVLVHITRALSPDVAPLAYAIALKAWSYIILVLIIIGTYRHRQRLLKSGSDRSWSPIRWQ